MGFRSLADTSHVRDHNRARLADQPTKTLDEASRISRTLRRRHEAVRDQGQAAIGQAAEPAPVRPSRAAGRLAIEPLGYRRVSPDDGPLRRRVDAAREDDLRRKEAAERLRRI